MAGVHHIYNTVSFAAACCASACAVYVPLPHSEIEGKLELTKNSLTFRRSSGQPPHQNKRQPSVPT